MAVGAHDIFDVINRVADARVFGDGFVGEVDFAVLVDSDVFEERVAALEEKLDAAEKKLKMADPDIAEYNTLIQKLISDYNVLDGLRKKITVHNKENGEKLKNMQTKMVSMMAQSLGM